MASKVTIYDVAKVAMVSPSTVSRAFSRPGRVSASTAQKVFAAAEELGYHAVQIIPASGSHENLGITKGMREFKPRARRKLFGVVVADATNPVSSALMRSAQAYADSLDASLVLIETQENSSKEKQLITQLIDLVDGFILASSRMTDSAIVQFAKIKPVVVINRVVRGVPSLLPDTDSGMCNIVEYSLQRNYRTICYLAGPESSWADGVRWRALNKYCTEMDLYARKLGSFKPTIVGGIDAANVWMRSVKDNPEVKVAVVGYNDYMAIGFMKTLQINGYTIPEDVAIIGIDNSVSCLLTTPSLTSVGVPPRALGVSALKTLFALIRRTDVVPPAVSYFPMELIERDSTVAD